MGEILQPVANILLMTSTVTVKFESIPDKKQKPWHFMPPVTIERDKYYIIHVTREEFPPSPLPQGFYEAPERGKIPFIKEFKLLQKSYPSAIPTWAWFYEAIEGTPPLDWKPDKQFDYRSFEIKEVALRRAERLSGTNITEV